MKKKLFLMFFIFFGLFSCIESVFAQISGPIITDFKIDTVNNTITGNIGGGVGSTLATQYIEFSFVNISENEESYIDEISWEEGPFTLQISGDIDYDKLNAKIQESFISAGSNTSGGFNTSNKVFDNIKYNYGLIQSAYIALSSNMFIGGNYSLVGTGSGTGNSSGMGLTTSNNSYIVQPLVNSNNKMLSANIPTSASGTIYINAIKTSGSAPTSASDILATTTIGSTQNTSGDFFLSLGSFLMNDPYISNGSNDYNYLEISNSPTSVFSDKQFAEINFISTPQSTISVDFLGNPTVTPKTDPVTGSPYYNIKGDFTRSENADVYLILKRQPKSGGQAGYGPLCHYPVDFGNTFGFYYGDGDAQPPLLPPTRCPGHPAELEAFSHLYNYSAYFAASMVTKQTPISDIISFPDISPPPLANPIDGLIVNPKKSGNKHYYEVSGTVNDTKPGNHKIVFHLLRLPDQIGGPKQEAGILGTIDYKAGNFDLLKNGIGSFAGVAPGSYLLEIRDNNGALLQEKILSDITESPSSGNSNYVPFEYTDEQQNIINNGLVTTECGYDLGPKGSGRMCGFADFVELIQRVIEYIFILVLPIAAIVFAYAGFLYMTSGGSPDKRSAAKKAMTSLVIGIVVVMAAWLIVKTILTALGASAGFTMFLNI